MKLTVGGKAGVTIPVGSEVLSDPVRLSFVTEAGNNSVVTEQKRAVGNEPAVKRLDRDVLGISGLSAMMWLEGMNDLGGGRNKPEPVIEGYKQVVSRLHAAGIFVVGATVTSAVWPEPTYENSPLGPGFGPLYGSPETNAYRKQLNDFIRTSGSYDSEADMSRATEDPGNGAMYREFQVGNDDYLHANRAGHQAMAAAVDIKVLDPSKLKAKLLKK